MSAPAVRPKRGRRALQWGGGILVAALVLQLGGAFLLNRWAEKKLGREAATLQVQLWSLKVRSREGTTRIGPLTVRWRGLVYSQFNGRLALESLALGTSGEPLAEARGIEVRGVFGTPEIRVRTLRVDAAAPGWSDLAKQVMSGSEGGASPRPKFVLWIETLTLDSPAGSAQGPLLVDLAEEGVACAFDLSGREGLHLKGEGRAGRERGEFLVSGTLRESPLMLSITGEGGDWRGQGVFGDCSSGWMVDGTLGKRGVAEILLQTRRSPGPPAWVLLTWSHLNAAGGYIPTIEMPEGGFGIASPALGLPAWLGRANIAAHTFQTGIANNTKHACVSVELRTGTGGYPRGAGDAFRVNLNWDHGVESTLLFEVTAGDGGVASLPFLGHPLLFGGLVEGLFEPRKHVLGALQSSSTQLQVRGDGSGEEGRGSFQGRHRKLGVSGLFSWSSGSLQGEIETRGPLPENPDWPIPAGSWAGRLRIDLPKGGPPRVELDAAGERGARLDGSLENGRVHLAGAGLRLAAAWGEVAGLRVSGDAEWSDFAKMPVNTRFQGQADSVEAGELRLANLAFSGSQEGATLAVDTAVDLPGLEGKARGTWRLPLSSPGGLSLASGEATLLGGTLTASGLRAEAFFQEPGRWLRWSASGATVSGEPLSALEGDCGPGADGNFTARGAGQGLGGRIAFEVHPAAGREALSIEATELEAAPFTRFLSRFQELPFGLSAGRVGVTVRAPLEAFGPGWVARVRPEGVTLLVPDDRHQFRGVGGTLLVHALAEGVRVESEGLTLEGGRVPVALQGEVGGTGAALRFSIPPTTAQDVQNALFDFLPEFVGYGEVKGKLGLEGAYRPEGTAPGFQVKARFESGAFASEDRSLVLEGLEGGMTLAVGTGGGGPALKGFSAPPPEDVRPVVGEFSRALAGGDTLAVRSIAFSVYSLSDVRLSSQGGEDGVTRLRVTEGTLWDGPVRAEVGLAIAATDIRYVGQVVMDHASLRQFCRESEGLTGFLGGRFSGSLTFRGDRMGLGALKALADIAVDPAGDEPLVLGRDFLVNVGGAPMKKLITRRFQEYDEASIRVGIRAGSLTVENLVLAHRADPLKALLRRDLSFELRVPLNNSISLYNLLDVVKGIGQRSASVETP